MRSIEIREPGAAGAAAIRRWDIAGRSGSRRSGPAWRSAAWLSAFLGALIIVAWLGSALGAGVWGLHASGLDEESYVQVTVKSGDTLWSLAKEHGPRGRDIRETIDRIRRINGLDDRASLRPGEQLTIPTR